MRAPLVLTVLILILASPGALAQTTWYVDDDNCPGGSGSQADPFCKIQDGIAAAFDGDTVLVLPGTYVENLDFLGKAITVRSDADGDPATHDPDPASTIVDGNQAGSVVVFVSGEGLDSVLEGFTITNGTGTYDGSSGSYVGGGVACHGSSPTVCGNVIDTNSAHNGGGISCLSGSSPLIRDDTISANTASGRPGGYGGGILSASSSHPTITHNTITGNTVTANRSGGGGICCTGDSASTITHNTITGNTAIGTNPDSWGGGICCMNDSSSTIAHNVISGNSALGTGDWTLGSVGGGITCMLNASPSTIADNIIEQNTTEYGGGIFCQDDAAFIVRNLISDNRAEGGGYLGYGSSGGGINWRDSKLRITDNVLSGNFADDMGGGLHGYQSPDPSLILNNTIHGNSATNYAGGLSLGDGTVATVANTISWGNNAPTGPEMAVIVTSTLSVEYTDLEGGQPSVYVEPGSNLSWGAGMIDVDPEFVNPANGDFQLLTTSPCIDVGNDDAECCDLDFVGNPRVLDGLLDEVMIVDMGACEFDHVQLAITGSATPGGTLTIATTGTAGMPVFLFAGMAPGEVCLPRYGCLFLKLSSPWYVTPWGTIPSSVTVTIPPAVPVPLDLLVQELALDPGPGSKAGNTSNPVELTIE